MKTQSDCQGSARSRTRIFVAVALLGLAGTGVAPPLFAQGVSLGDVLQKGGVKLSAEDVRTTVAGAKVTSIAANGSTRNWQNEAGGKFMATSDGAGQSGAAGRRGGLVQGTGTWQVDETGRYCVEISWGKAPEKWCRFIFKAGDKFYASNSDSKSDTNVHEINFKK